MNIASHKYQTERYANETVRYAALVLQRAIAAFEAAGYGSHVTDPMRDALKNVQWSIRELQ